MTAEAQPDPAPTPAEETVGSVWVRTVPTPDGAGYMVSVELDDDTARPLSPLDVPAYVRAVVSAASAAEYDAAVFTQLMRTVEMSAVEVAKTVAELRSRRAPLDATAMAPLLLQPAVNPSGKPFLVLQIRGRVVGQWTLGDARSHAMGVLEADASRHLDEVYRDWLMNAAGLDPGTAHAVVADLVDVRAAVRFIAERGAR